MKYEYGGLMAASWDLLRGTRLRGQICRSIGQRSSVVGSLFSMSAAGPGGCCLTSCLKVWP